MGPTYLRNSSSIINEQDEKVQWARISSLLEKDTDTEAFGGTLIYKVLGKMANYSSAYRGLPHIVGMGS